MLVDDRLAMLGSYNFEHAADDRLAEAMLSSTDPRVVAAVSRVLEDCAATCERVTRESFARLPGRLHWQRRLLRPLRRWM